MVMSASHTLLRLVSVVEYRRDPQTWFSEFTTKVPCHSITVETKKPQTSAGAPPMRKMTTARRTGGSRWNRFRNRISGNRERSLISAVPAYLRHRIHPAWLHQKPFFGEWMSPGSSEYLWWSRWCAAHHSIPFWVLDCAQNASTNWKAREVLKERCEAYRW